ncbi:unnamed protein product [Durusdinium trenchii]|uniref:Myosin heavy chain kinase C n=2 Tax=Durusdinium trenchii TaxID=1381693 RepID=A0ABP0JZZ5_9DINO
MERLGSPQLFQGSRGSSRPNSRPNSSGLSEFEAYARHVQREDGKARKESAYEADTANRATLQEWLGPLRKTGKQLGEHTATGGMYLKYKACRLMDNPSSKALNGENIDRIQLETAWSCPTVRTVLRITDDLHLDDQIRSSGSDDIVREIVGTASSSFMAAMAKIDELRDDVQVQRDERRVQAESNLSKVAYQSLYGLKQVQEPKQTVTHGRSRRRSSVGSALSSEDPREDQLRQKVQVFDRWMYGHLAEERNLSRQNENRRRLPPVRLDMRLLGLAE